VNASGKTETKILSFSMIMAFSKVSN